MVRGAGAAIVLHFAGLASRSSVATANKSGFSMMNFKRLRMVAVAAFAALAPMSSAAFAAQCGNTAAGFEAWKQSFSQEARARGVGASAISALMGTHYATATINADRGQRSFHLPFDAFMHKRG